MRIGIYTPYLDTLAGGEKYILTVATCLAGKHEVSLFWDTHEEKSLKQEIKRKFDLDFSHISFVENIFASKISLFTRLKKSQKYDAIIVLSDGSIPVVSSRLILHFQTPMPWIRPSLKQRAKLLRVSHIICNSLYTKKYIDKEFGVQSSVIYPPITIDKKSLEKENIILHVGRFGITNQGSSAKKQEFMGEVFKKMIDGGLSHWKLVFVMSYKNDVADDVAAFKTQMKNYPIEIVENPTNEQLWEMYNKAKIYWHASGMNEDLEKNPGRAEHFGMATVEAMGVGSVPIVINAGGQKEIVEHNRNGLLWDTQEELIEQTHTVMRNPKLWETFSEEAKKTAGKFNTERFCEEWNKIII